MFTLLQTKEHLVGMGHGGTLNKVRNQEALFERAAGIYLNKCKPIDVIRLAPLTNVIHDDIYNYALPSDFGAIIDLMPQADRTNWDSSFRNPAGQFDLEKAIKQRTISIEGSEGTKIIRINWRSRAGKVLNRMESLTENGTWGAVATAANLEQDAITKYSGVGSVRFDVVASGDGIQNTSMTALDLTDEDEIADVFVAVYFPTTSAITSLSALWGNDLTTNYWASTAQTTQFDGTAFKTGWNIIKFAWSGATETGTVDPSLIDSFRLTVASTGAVPNVRVDNIIFSVGKAFDIKYYSKYIFKSATSGTWISRPTSDNDIVMVDNDSLPQYLYECLQEMAQQMEGTDGAFDIQFADKRLKELYPAYKTAYPNMVKKSVGKYGALPRIKRYFR